MLAALEATRGALADVRHADPERGPMVSIVMPTRNRANILGAAIASVVEQTYPRWELLVTDDGGDDDSSAVVAAFDDPRISYRKLTHGGAARARNAALAAARGDLIAYLDSDNVWHPEFLAVMAGALDADPFAAAAYCAYLDVEVAGDRLRPKKWGPLPFDYDRLEERNFIDLNTVVHRRGLYERLGGFNPELSRQQDWDLLLRYTFAQDPAYVDLLLVLYRRNVAWNQITQVHKADPRPTETIRAAVAGYYATGVPVQQGPGRRVLVCAPGGGETAGRVQDLQAAMDGTMPVEHFRAGAAAGPDDVLLALDATFDGLGAALLENARTGRPVVLDLDPSRWPARVPPLPLATADPSDPGFAVAASPQWTALLLGLVPALPVTIHPRDPRPGPFGATARVVAGVLPDDVTTDDAARREARAELGFGPDDLVLGWVGPVAPDDADAARFAVEVDPRHRLLILAEESSVVAAVGAVDTLIVPPLRGAASVRLRRLAQAAAMARGTPVVTSAADDLGVGDPAKYGWRSEPWDALGVICGLGMVLRDPQSMASVGDRARRLALRRFVHRAGRLPLCDALATARPGALDVAVEFAAFVERTAGGRFT